MPNTPIVISFTPNYLIPAATTLLSILKSSDVADQFDIICLLSENLSDKERDSLINLDSERLVFNFLLLDDKLKDIYIDQRYSIAASYRLLLPDLLPQYDSVIYLDCDIIVRNNIAKLYSEINLSNFYLAAVFEATLDFQIPYVKDLGIPVGKYFNSGFLIMNLAKMRQDSISNLLIEKADNPKSSFPDQDALNLECKDMVFPLNPIYNSIRTYFIPQYKKDFLNYYSEIEWENVQCFGNIHYTGAKPWDSYTVKFDVWWKYYELLPIQIKNLGKVSLKMRLFSKFFQFKFVIFIYKIFQNIYRKLKLFQYRK